MKSINYHNCHVAIVADETIAEITQINDSTFECYLYPDSLFEMRVSYFGFECIKYNITVDERPLGVFKGKPIFGVLSYINNDIHDVWQNFHEEKTKWMFKSKSVKIDVDLYPAKLERSRGMSNTDVKKTIEVQQVNYSVNTDYDNKKSFTLFLKEKQDDIIYSPNI